MDKHNTIYNTVASLYTMLNYTITKGISCNIFTGKCATKFQYVDCLHCLRADTLTCTHI